MFARLDENKLDKRKFVINTQLPIYITMSTIPSRMSNTFKIIKHMLEHLQGNIARIILNIPYKYNRWPYLIPSVDLYAKNIKDPRFYLNRTQDIGPLTKFLPSLSLIPDESIIIVADDMCYDLEAFKDIAERQDMERNKSFSFFVYNFRANDKIDSDDGFVKVPQGADLISMYARNVDNFPKWFEEFKKSLGIEKYFDSPCFFVDDQVFGWYFQYQGIPLQQVDRKHRMIYIKGCDISPESDNLNKQRGKNSRENTMNGCYHQLKDFIPHFI